MSGPRYTVVGARGFIGARVAATLKAEGLEVFEPARDDEAWLDQDLGRVFYCAGLTGDYRTRPFATVEAHVGLLARLLERGRYERIVILSSTRPYGWDGRTEGRETDPLTLDPNNADHIYELSKALGENLTLHQSGGRGAVARLSYVFDDAEGAEGFLSDWIAAAKSQREVVLQSSAGAARDYIHVDDVVRALRAIVDSDINEIVNVASGEVVSNADLAERFERAGWSTRFTQTAAGPPPPRMTVARLAALGVVSRSVRDLLAMRLEALRRLSA